MVMKFLQVAVMTFGLSQASALMAANCGCDNCACEQCDCGAECDCGDCG